MSLEEAKEMSILSSAAAAIEESHANKIEMVSMDMPSTSNTSKLVKSDVKKRKISKKDLRQLEKRLLVFGIGVLILAISIFTHNLTDFDSMLSEKPENSTTIVDWNSTSPKWNYHFYIY